jgi:hypothetical protein
MRTRLLVLLTLLCTIFAVGLPKMAGAAPANNHGLTISATPNPILAGQGVLIYGQLNTADNAGQKIKLFHRISPKTSFSLVQTTTTNSFGFYDFTRAEGVVTSNRSWFATGPDGTHSRTITEGVAALVSLSASNTNAVTGQRIVFTGNVSPSHPYQLVKLEEQNGLFGNVLTTIASTYTDASSNFDLSHRWALPGDYTLRAVFPSDARNLEGDSDSITVAVQQKQHSLFTINSSDPIIAAGGSVTISGTLYSSGSTPEGSIVVGLYGGKPGGTKELLATMMTGSNGSYSFTRSPTHNKVYLVATTSKPLRETANLYEGVQDVLTILASSTMSEQGGNVTLSGIVTPDHAGHVIYLQILGIHGFWHNVATGVVASASKYSFTYTFGEDGTVQLRARIYGGPENIGGASSAVTITVSGVSPPPAS